MANFLHGVTGSDITTAGGSGLVYENDDSLRLARIVCTQVAMPIVCVIGVATNALNIVVLTTATMRSSTSCYLCAVALYDLLYSLTGLPLTLRTYTFLEKSPTYMHALKYLLSFGNMWSNTAAWLTCTFTIERFMAISTPIRSRKNFTIRRTQWSIFFVCLVTAIITLPDFFERQIREARGNCHNETASTSSVQFTASPHICGETFYVFEATWMSEQLNRFGWSYARAALFVFIPLIILAIFNALLIKSVIKAHHARGSMLADPGTRQHRRRCHRNSHKSNVHATEKAEPEAARRPTRGGSFFSRTRKDLAWRKWWITRQFSQKHSSSNQERSITGSIHSKGGNSTEKTLTSNSAGLALEPEKTNSGAGNSVVIVSSLSDQARGKRPFLFCLRRYPHPSHGDSFVYRSSYQDKQAITVTLIAVVVVFCILTTPSAILHLIQTWFDPNDLRLKVFGNVSNLLLMLNSALNFFLYSLFSARFRRSFRTLLMKRRC